MWLLAKIWNVLGERMISRLFLEIKYDRTSEFGGSIFHDFNFKSPKI